MPALVVLVRVFSGTDVAAGGVGGRGG